MSAKQAAERVVTVAGNPAATQEEIMTWVKEFFDAVREADGAEAAEGLAALGAGIELADGERAAFIATVCGALVEGGMDPTPIVEPLLARLGQVVPAAREFHRACVALMPAEPEDRGEAFEQTMIRVAAEMPDGAAAFGLMNRIYPPAVAVFSVSPSARTRGRALVELLEEMAGDQEGAHWLTKMLKVLHDEPYLAIEVPTGRGIVGRMSGIAENFQLNVLSMDVFPRGVLSQRRVSEEAARVAREEGPQQSGEGLQGFWNLYTYRALRGDGTLPDAKSQADYAEWIWNEGVPADIATFEGRRVILLGPPSYSRGWRSQRAFARLRAELSVERELGKSEVRAWLARIVEANTKGE